jgi:hypothetical protein
LWYLQHNLNRWTLSSLYSGEEEERPVVQGFLCIYYVLTSENFKMTEGRTTSEMWTGSYIKKYVPSATHNFCLSFTEYQMDGPIKNVDSCLHLQQALIIPEGTGHYRVL